MRSLHFWCATGTAVLALMGCRPASVKPPPESPQPPPAASTAPRSAGLAKGRWPVGAKLLPPDGHMARINCLSFSPDGRQILAGSDDRALLVWDVETKRVVQRFAGHSGAVKGCAFFPDGRRVASGGAEGEVFVWDVGTGARRKLGALGDVDVVHALAVRADGREVMVGTELGHVRAWDAQSGTETFRSDELVADPGSSTVRTVGYLDDGRRFGGGDINVTLVWGAAKPVSIFMAPANALALPGGRLLLSERGLVIAEDGKTTTWRAATRSPARGLAASRDLILAGDATGDALIMEFPSGATRCQLPWSRGIEAAAFDPSGERFAVAGEDAEVVLGRSASCKSSDLEHLAAKRTRLTRAAAGESLLLGDSTGFIRSWSLTTFWLTATVQAHGGAVHSLSFLPNGTWVSGGADRAVALASREGADVLSKVPDVVWRAVPTPDAQAILAVDGSGHLTRVPIDGSRNDTDLLAVREALHALAVRPGKREAVVGGTETLRIALPPKGAPTAWRDASAKGSVSALAYDPEGKWLGEGHTRGGITLRDADTGEIRRRLSGLGRHVSALVLTRDHVWAGGDDQKLVRWSLAAGAEPDLAPIDEGSPILDVAVTPDGSRLVAVLADGRASVRALPEGTLVAQIIHFRDGTSATLFGDGRYQVPSPGDASSLAFEDPRTHEVIRLGD